MNTATHTVVRTFGAVMGLAGIEHGIGEILQGDRAPTGLMILSWPDADFFRIVNGEPALTIVPNLLLTGILATLVSLAYLVWAVVFAERKNSGRVLGLLALGMLLVGGGIFPPILGMLIGLVAARIPMRDGRRNAPTTWQQWISGLWPWSYRASIVAWLALFPGLNILGSYLFTGSAEESLKLP